MPLIFSGDETTDVGVDLGSPVAEDDYGVRGNQFSGTVHWAEWDRGLDDTDHLISPEERWRIAVGDSIAEVPGMFLEFAHYIMAHPPLNAQAGHLSSGRVLINIRFDTLNVKRSTLNVKRCLANVKRQTSHHVFHASSWNYTRFGRDKRS